MCKHIIRKEKQFSVGFLTYYVNQRAFSLSPELFHSTE